MTYAKLVDGNLAYATNPLRIGTRHVYTTDPTPYGYKEVVRDAPTPPDGYVAVHDGWQETDTQIVETYRMEPIEPTDVEIVMDAVADLSEVVSNTSESVSDNADAIAELSELVSEIISGGE